MAFIGTEVAPFAGVFVNTQAETWLFLEDSAVDRRHMDQAVKDLHRGIRLLQASSMHEAREILAKHPVAVFLTDFYLRNGLTSSKFIAEVRASFPRLPIVVVTGQTQNQEAPYSAGADSVIPKMESLTEFTKAIAAAVNHAKHVRSIEHRDVKRSDVFVPKSIASEFQRIIRKPAGSFLISSDSGMGRSTLAKHLAKQIVSEHPSQFDAGIHLLTCTGKNYSDFDFEERLFGCTNPRSSRAVGLLEKAQDGVLIIDDANHLPPAVQSALKEMWGQGSATMHNGVLVRAARVNLILTARKDAIRNDTVPFERGFVQTVVSQRISIPDFAELSNEYSEISKHLLASHAVSGTQTPMEGSSEFFERLMQFIIASPTRVTFRSLARTIDGAVENARNRRRTLLMPDDLLDAPFLYENTSSARRDSDRDDFSFIDGSDPLSPEQWRELAETIRSGTFPQAEALLINMMLTCANIRFNNNKAKIAEALGLSRSTLYRYPQFNMSSQRGLVAKNISFARAPQERSLSHE